MLRIWRFFLILMLLILMLSLTSALNAQDGIQATTIDNAKLRLGAGRDFNALVTVPFNTTVRAIARNEDSSWIQVDYNGTTGWIAEWLLNPSGDLNNLPVSNALTSAPIVSQAESPLPGQGVAATNSDLLNVRAAPSRSGAPLGQLAAGSSMILTGRCGSDNNLWVRFVFNSQEAWLAGWLLNINGDVNVLPEVCAPIVNGNEGLLAANFNSCGGTNNLGGSMGRAQPQAFPGNTLEESYIAEGGGCVARLKFTLPDQWSAFWMKLGGVDLCPYSKLVFDIRADNPIPGEIKVELKRAGNREIGIRYVNQISGGWQTVTVNIRDFVYPGYESGLRDCTAMEELVFVFERSRSGGQGVVYLDNIRFT